MKAACEGVDFILHQGALASVPRSVKDPAHLARVQHQRHAESAHRRPRRKGSPHRLRSLLLGLRRPAHPAQAGGHARLCPLSPYAVQKLTCEYYIQSFYRAYGLEGVCLRYFNIFGPRQAADSPYSGVIAQFTYKMMAGETPTIFGDGLTSRDFNYIDNAVSANLLACLAPSEVATGRVFNIGTGKSHTLNEVYAAIAGQLGFTAKPNYGPPREGDIKHSLADITRATKELGYQPKAQFHEGLRKTVAWYLSEQEKTQVAALQG